MVEEPGDAGGCISGMEAHRADLDLISLEQPAADSRVLGGNERHGSEDLEGTERNVAEVPDRSRDDEQRPSLGHPRVEPGRRRG